MFDLSKKKKSFDGSVEWGQMMEENKRGGEREWEGRERQPWAVPVGGSEWKQRRWGERRTVRRRQRFVWPSVVCDIWGGRQRLLTFLFFPFSVHGLFGFFFFLCGFFRLAPSSSIFYSLLFPTQNGNEKLEMILTLQFLVWDLKLFTDLIRRVWEKAWILTSCLGQRKVRKLLQ